MEPFMPAELPYFCFELPVVVSCVFFNFSVFLTDIIYSYLFKNDF